MSTVSFSIKPTIHAEPAKAGLKDIASLLREQKSLEKSLAQAEEHRLKESTKGTDKLKGELRSVNRELAEMKEKSEKAKEKFATIGEGLNAGGFGKLGGLASLAGGIVGGAGIGAVFSIVEKMGDFAKETVEFVVDKAKELYREGRTDVELRKKFTRLYGEERAESYDRMAKLIGGRAGIETSSAGRGLLEMREAMPDIIAGMRVSASLAKQLGMGQRRTLNDSDADRLQEQMMVRRGTLLARLQTLRPDIDAGHMGRMLGDAASGLGMRQLAGELGLGKQAAKIISANETGSLGKKDLSRLGLTAADLKGYEMDGGKLRSFDVLDLILKKRGLGEDAAADKRKTLDFQIDSIKATLGDAFSDIGSAVYEGINGPLAKGVTLADKFKEYMASPDGKKMVHDIAVELGKVAKWIGDIIAAIPRMIGYLDDAYKKIKPLIDMNDRVVKMFNIQGFSTATSGAMTNIIKKSYGLDIPDAPVRRTTPEGGTHAAPSKPDETVINLHIDGEKVASVTHKHAMRLMTDEIARSSAFGAAPHSAP